MFLSLLALSLLQTPADVREAKLIAFPRAAGTAEFVGLQIRGDGNGRCFVVESSGSTDADAFACANGRAQLRYRDGRVYAMTFVPPPVTGTYVRAHRPPAETRPSRRPRRNGSPGIDPERGADGIVATLVARYEIDAQGQITECVVEGPSGNPRIDSSMCEAFREVRYVPATLDGAPVAETRYEIITVRRETFTTSSPWEGATSAPATGQSPQRDD